MVFFRVFVYLWNALNVQQEYTEFRIEEAIDDLLMCEEFKPNDDLTLQVTGTIGYAPAVENMLEHYPLLEKIVPITFCGDNFWGEYTLRNYYGLPAMADAITYDEPEGEFTKTVESYYHTIRERENYIWIELH